MPHWHFKFEWNNSADKVIKYFVHHEFRVSIIKKQKDRRLYEIFVVF